MPKRCKWCNLNNPKYIAYHDEEWGVLRTDDAYLFEMLLLESFQAGLSWECILNKRENFRNAFDNFDAAKIRGKGAGSLRRPRHCAKPSENSCQCTQCRRVSDDLRGIRRVLRLSVPVHAWQHTDGNRPHHQSPVRCHFPRPEKQRHAVCGQHGDLCLFAGGWCDFCS